MSFGSPLILLALLGVLAVLAALAILLRRRPGAPVAFTNLAVLEAVASARGPSPAPVRSRGAARRWRSRFAAGAAAHPQARLPVRVDNATIVLLVDVSGSMSARDVEPTRLDAAVAAMRGFVQRLPKGFKVGLVQFSDASAGACRPDRRPRADRPDARPARTPNPGPRSATGLVTATRLVQSSLAGTASSACAGRDLPAAIVLLSDGKQNQGQVQPLAAATLAKAAGIPVDTVALGTTQGVLGYGPYAPKVAPDPPLMSAIARVTGGRTATATDSQGAHAPSTGASGAASGTRPRPATSARGSPRAAALLLVAAVALGRAWAGAFS